MKNNIKLLSSMDFWGAVTVWRLWNGTKS